MNFRIAFLAVLASFTLSPVMSQRPYQPGMPGLRLSGNVSYLEEETSAIWQVSLQANPNRRRGKSRKQQIRRTQSIGTHRFNEDGREIEYCQYRSRSAGLATIEIGADDSPAILQDSIDRSVPALRYTYLYIGPDSCIETRWESELGRERLVGTDTIAATPALPAPTEYIDSDGLSTRYVYNRRGDLYRMERDWDSTTMSVTIFDDYQYDIYGNWTFHNIYSLQPDGRHRLTGCTFRRYTYR